MTTKILAQNKGQAAIEAALAAPVLALALVALLYLSYHGLVYFYAGYNLDEALICLTDSRQGSDCQKKLEKKLGAILIFREGHRARLQVRRDRIEGQLDIGLFRRIQLSKVLQLPLERNL